MWNSNDKNHHPVAKLRGLLLTLLEMDRLRILEGDKELKSKGRDLTLPKPCSMVSEKVIKFHVSESVLHIVTAYLSGQESLQSLRKLEAFLEAYSGSSLTIEESLDSLEWHQNPSQCDLSSFLSLISSHFPTDPLL